MTYHNKTMLLNEYLFRHSAGETEHLKHPGVLSEMYKSIRRVTFEGEELYYFDAKRFIEGKNIAIIKESRFTTVPKHLNRNMQMYFMYSGTTLCVIRDHDITLHAGDVLLIDCETPHSFPKEKNEDDILINVFFESDFFNNIFFSHFTDRNPITSFLLNSVSLKRRERNYFYFSAEEIPHIYTLFTFLLENYFFPDTNNNDIIDSYISTIFHELVNSLERHPTIKVRSEGKTAFIIRYITENCRTCTLSSVASAFSYHPCYLSNLLKRETGRTFSEIKLSGQLYEATFLLRTADKSITEIIQEVGITNNTYFYRKFHDMYGCTPKQYKKIISSS